MILITSFKPWGLFKRKTNISEEVAESIRYGLGIHPSLLKQKDIKFISFKANDEGIESFKSLLKYERPDVIIHLGEIPYSSDFRIEGSATGEAYINKNGKIKMVKRKRIQSDLARYLGLISDIKVSDKIGMGYCNKIYFASLVQNYRSIFIHIGSKCDINDIELNLLKVIKKCKEVGLKDG